MKRPLALCSADRWPSPLVRHTFFTATNAATLSSLCSQLCMPLPGHSPHSLARIIVYCRLLVAFVVVVVLFINLFFRILHSFLLSDNANGCHLIIAFFELCVLAGLSDSLLALHSQSTALPADCPVPLSSRPAAVDFAKVSARCGTIPNNANKLADTHPHVRWPSTPWPRV